MQGNAPRYHAKVKNKQNKRNVRFMKSSIMTRSFYCEEEEETFLSGTWSTTIGGGVLNCVNTCCIVYISNDNESLLTSFVESLITHHIKSVLGKKNTLWYNYPKGGSDMLHTPLMVTITKNEIKVNKADANIPKVTNLILNGLCTLWENAIHSNASNPTKTREAEREIYEMASIAFSNLLAHIAPEEYFLTEEELKNLIAEEQADLQRRVDAGEGSEIDFEELKTQQMERIEAVKRFQEEHPEVMMDA